MRKSLLLLLFPSLPSIALAQGATPPIGTTPGTPTAITTTPGSSQTIDEIRRNYRVHAGPLYINPGILLKELGVDTNVFNQPGDQKSDFTFTLTPKADVALPIARRGLLRTTMAVDGVYYARYASERSFDPQVTVRGEAYANRLTVFAQGEYVNTRARPNYEIDLRSRHVDTEASGGAGVRLTTKVSLELAGRLSATQYDADQFILGTSLRDTLNRDTTGYAAILRDRLTSLTTVAMRYETRRDRFPHSPLRDNNSYRLMPGVEFKPKALISGSAYVGYRRLSPRNPELPPYTGLVSELTLAYTLLGATTFGVTYNRDVAYSFEVVNPYFLDNSVSIFVRRALGGGFDVLVNAARHRYDYRDLAIADVAPLEPRVDITDNYVVNVGHRMRRNTRLGIGASYFTRDSTRETLRRYDGLRAGLTMNYGF